MQRRLVALFSPRTRCNSGRGRGLLRGRDARNDSRPAENAGTGCCRRLAGFTLLELMIVISIILILISIAAPIYRTSIIRSKEAVLRDDLFTLRSLIDQYTVDKQEAPQALEDLVEAGYLRQVPTDPFTGSSQTWEVVFEEDVLMNPDQKAPGIIDVRSGSNLRSLSGELYNTW